MDSFLLLSCLRCVYTVCVSVSMYFAHFPHSTCWFSFFSSFFFLTKFYFNEFPLDSSRTRSRCAIANCAHLRETPTRFANSWIICCTLDFLHVWWLTKKKRKEKTHSFTTTTFSHQHWTNVKESNNHVHRVQCVLHRILVWTIVVTTYKHKRWLLLLMLLFTLLLLLLSLFFVLRFYFSIILFGFSILMF